MKELKNKFLFCLYSFRWSLVALMSIFAITLLGVLAIFKVNITELSIDWSAASAISTFLAVLVALAFGLRESFERRAERKKKSTLAASSLMSTLVAIRQHIEWTLAEYQSQENLSKPAVEVISMIVGHLNAYTLISSEHLEDIYDEDQRMALALANSLSDLRNRVYILNMNFTLSDSELWLSYLQRCGVSSETLSQGLSEISGNLSKAAGIAESIRDKAFGR